ncbi:hypothetical protein [Flavisolibacter ginsengisoli]|jgi:hypothetical protein|uniref:T9SS C-terminal target domain-containing protein n=1 Tax=Flavisolibacter ginsengisoli DSM 18119 TaxID=1121884 RepID=A0A1M5DHQ5_9BACT|nr:hypothetical protein [Flavisolibacter ginsengisoli]SHF66500.1 hypothetical protein SAMN02745131_03230 [Flavisolibacter ginsengisoli DSM 18119]
MKKLLTLTAIIGLLSSGCRKIEMDGGTTVVTPTTGTENTILEGRITENRTLKAGNTYKLRGLVYVTNGAVLTIEPGTKIVGETGQRGGLIITRNAKISADGTIDKPIVFTSESASPQRGDWAGVVILGNAPVNASFNGVQGVGEIEGGINNSDGLGLYGGTNPADNSGILRYVRIEYAGYAFLPDKEINGLTFGGVGNQTVVDYVQVSYANDDSFEWFGGTVNCKHLISFRTLDDDFDTDNGFSGKVQFGIVLRDSSVADISKSEAFESDNDANGSSLTPQTSAVFSNITALGPKATLANTGNNLFVWGAQIRRNSSISIFNSLIMGWPTGLYIDATKGTPTDNNIPGSLFVQNTIIAGSPTAVLYGASTTSPTGATTASINTWFNTAAYGSSVLTNNSDVGLTAPFNYTAPDFNPAAGSPAAAGGIFTHAKLNGLTNVNYKGACAVGDTWWKNWTKFM